MAIYFRADQLMSSEAPPTLQQEKYDEKLAGNTQESSTASTVSPCKCPHTDQVIEVPETDQGVCAASGKVVASGVKLNADAVGWVGVQHMLKLQVRITEGKKQFKKKKYSSC